jgi:hypothetical protein
MNLHPLGDRCPHPKPKPVWTTPLPSATPRDRRPVGNCSPQPNPSTTKDHCPLGDRCPHPILPTTRDQCPLGNQCPRLNRTCRHPAEEQPREPKPFQFLISSCHNQESRNLFKSSSRAAVGGMERPQMHTDNKSLDNPITTSYAGAVVHLSPLGVHQHQFSCSTWNQADDVQFVCTALMPNAAQ